MAAPETPVKPVPRQIPHGIRQNAEERRLISYEITPANPTPKTSPELRQIAIESVQNHSHEIFIQCLYMLPVVGNAMSLYDVGTDIYGICSDEQKAKNLTSWGILAIDAIGVIPAAGNASRPARAVVKEVLLAFAKGAAASVLVDLFWATAGGDAIAFMEELDKKLHGWKEDISRGIHTASRTLRTFVENPVSAATQMGVIKKNDGFLSWIPTGEEIALHGIDELLKLSGQKQTILKWLDEFDRNSDAMLGKAFGDAAAAGSLLFMAAQIVQEIKYRKARGIASHTAHAAPGTAHEPHVKPGTHNESTQKGAKPGDLPTKKGCGCPATATPKPVNYALGDEHLDQTDFTLDGVTPIVWTRSYRSSLAAYNDSSLGARWSSPYHLSLEERDGVLTFFDPDSRAVPLPKVDIGETVQVPTEQLIVSRPDRRSVRLAYPDGSREDYELSRNRYRLIARTGRDGLGLMFGYNEAGELVTITDGAENNLRLDYENGRVITICRTGIPGIANEAIARYVYNVQGDLIEHQDVLGHKRTYTYEQHLLTRYTDFNGNGANLEWDWIGKGSGIPAPADARCVRTWLGDAIDKAIDPRARRDVREETRFEYHREHWYTKVTDADGHATIHRYDQHNRIILVEHPDGTSEAFNWNENHQLVSMKNALGQTQRFDYDGQGRVTALTDALSMTTRTEYNADGLPVKVTNAIGDVTLTDFDALGRPVSVTDPAGRTTQYTWNGNGRLIALTDPKGGVKRFQYDNAGRLMVSTDCSGHATRFSHDERGYLSGVTDAEGNETSYRRDARGQLTTIRRADGVEEQFTWDGNGNLTTYRDGADQVTEYAYNALNQLNSRNVINRQATTVEERWNYSVGYSYDKQGWLTTLHNENREATTFRYDSLGQLIEETGFDGRTISYEYDDAGRLAVTREGDIETRHERDPLGRLTERKIGNHAGERFYYDARGRLVTAQCSGSNVRLHYDDADNLIAEEQSIRPGDGHYLSVTRHEYDALGNRTKTILPNTRTIDWLRYGSGHVHGVLLDGKPLLDFERDKLHREIGRTHRNFTQTRGYDRVGRLAQMSVRHASAANLADEIAGRKFRYSAAGHLTRIEDRTRGATDYTYDPVGRLLSSVTSSLKEVFAYDFAGNRVDPEKVPPRPVVESVEERAAREAREKAEDDAWLKAHPGETYAPGRANRTWDENNKIRAWRAALPKCIGNVLKELDGVRYEYDTRGNLIGKTERGVPWQYEYDASNRLTQVRRYPAMRSSWETGYGAREAESKPNPDLVVRFEYDAFGRRVVKRVQPASGPAEVTLFTWDGDVLLMEERFETLPQVYGRERRSENHGFKIVREDPSDEYSLPLAQRMHTLDARYQWLRASLYLHEPGTFVPLARLDERLVEPAFLATGTDGQFVQVPAKSRHATVFYQNDGLGTPQELLNDSGKVVWLARYKAWGGLRSAPYNQPDPSETDNAIRYQGSTKTRKRACTTIDIGTMIR